MHNPSRPLTYKPETRLRHGLALTCFSLLFCLQPALATEGSELAELKEMGIEGLLDLEITSVAKKSQKLWGSAAAIYVIDQEQIRRSGLTSIPELLRLAPGIHVAKINANTWAITARGFNQRFSNKLLVLIDGRTVYTPLHSGVYWDLQDTVISDIERIEVIRGPGATIWGANAVNGVINIITKSAGDTQATICWPGPAARSVPANSATVAAWAHWPTTGSMPNISSVTDRSIRPVMIRSTTGMANRSAFGSMPRRRLSTTSACRGICTMVTPARPSAGPVAISPIGPIAQGATCCSPGSASWVKAVRPGSSCF